MGVLSGVISLSMDLNLRRIKGFASLAFPARIHVSVSMSQDIWPVSGEFQLRNGLTPFHTTPFVFWAI